jgi:FtsP/CotA-like multicopper oxidase with cupredoxin domain
MSTRRSFLKLTGASTIGWYVATKAGWVQRAVAQIPGGTLDPADVPKYVTPMLIPPAMPQAGTIKMPGGQNADYYEISMKQFEQQILPVGYDPTTVWGYGAVASANKRGLLLHHAPSLTIETHFKRPVRVKWINDLVDPDSGNYLPHLLAVDPTLHWANPPGGTDGRDTRPTFDTTPLAYDGPVPMVTHVHGAISVGDESDGYAEAWFLPDAGGIPMEYATEGTWYDFFAGKAAAKFGVTWGPGFAVFQYPNDQRATTLWYHDHTLGMTRLNVYAGPAGFWLVRQGPDADIRDSRDPINTKAVLPGPAPNENDQFPPNKTYYEIPIAIQDRSFNSDASLFYPDTREFFDGIVSPYIPDGPFSPIWNPEFFGNMIMVNGNTWPFLTVEQRRYRLRFLNGCQSRFLILDFSGIDGVEVWAIGNEGGLLAAPVNLTADNNNRLLMALAERADLIVDFTNVPVTGTGAPYVLANVGPDEPFGGGEPPGDFDAADPATTGQVMGFVVVPVVGTDLTTPPQFFQLPAITPLPTASVTRHLALLEAAADGVDKDGNPVEGPTEALLGTVDPNTGECTVQLWGAPLTENPGLGATEVWEIYNATGDAHPIHIHELAFQVVDRQNILVGENQTGMVTVEVDSTSDPTGPEPWETGFKDTVIAYPDQVTRVKATFETAGQFVWHCHIVEHEDNEMMRPYRIGPVQPGQPG